MMSNEQLDKLLQKGRMILKLSSDSFIVINFVDSASKQWNLPGAVQELPVVMKEENQSVSR